MSTFDHSKKLASVAEEDFIGRTSELEKILRHGKRKTKSNGLVLLSTPAIGASELLCQAFDRLFSKQTVTVPFYFSIDPNDKTIKETAKRFLKTYLRQVIAFRKHDTKILESTASVDELAQLSVPSDGFWIDRLIASCRSENVLNDDRLFIKSCFSAPCYASAHGVESYVMIDNLHDSELLSGEIDLIEELKDIYGSAEVQYVLSGRRRFLLNSLQTGKTQLYETEILGLGPLEFPDAGILSENLAGKFDVKINDQTRDLISRKFLGNPLFINFLFQSAKERNSNLDNFQSVEKIYTEELFEGKISAHFESVFDEIHHDKEIQKKIIGLLHDVVSGERRRSPLDSWQAYLGLNEQDFGDVMRRMNNLEIVRISSNIVEAADENEVLTDYINKRFCLEIEIKPKVLVIVEALRDFLKRAPKTMAKFYRLNSAIDLRELLGIFNCQPIPLDLLDYEIFKAKHKGLEDIQILENLTGEEPTGALPQIVYSAPTVEFYPPIGQFVDAQHSVVALGFDTANYTDEDEVIWIAAEIESKLEASKELMEFWCDRLEMVATVCNFQRFKLWIITPEGFTREALTVLKERNAYGSSRKQVELLKKLLNAEDAIGDQRNQNEYEMIVPMGEDTELIAAHTVEEIARRHDFEPRAINQIKTALVEACINATEHSLSPDQKIYQKFSVKDDKIVITISNRGVRISDKEPQEISPLDERRGWGLKLLKSLMDDVKFEQVNDGTRISMTKYLRTSPKEKADGVAA